MRGCCERFPRNVLPDGAPVETLQVGSTAHPIQPPYPFGIFYLCRQSARATLSPGPGRSKRRTAQHTPPQVFFFLPQTKTKSPAPLGGSRVTPLCILPFGLSAGV